MVDKNIESKLKIEDFKDSSKKDILFELIMMRFDEMEEFKGSLARVLDASKKNPILISIITQNVDGFHQEAGSKNVIELHGNISKVSCIHCKKKYPESKIFKTDCLHFETCAKVSNYTMT